MTIDTRCGEANVEINLRCGNRITFGRLLPSNQRALNTKDTKGTKKIIQEALAKNFFVFFASFVVKDL